MVRALALITVVIAVAQFTFHGGTLVPLLLNGVRRASTSRSSSIVNHCGHTDLYVVWPTTETGWYLPVALLDEEKANAPYAPGRSAV